MARGFTAAAGNYLATTSSPADTLWVGALSVSVHAYILSGSADRHFIGKHLDNGGIDNPIDFRTNNDATPLLYIVRANAASETRQWSGPSVVLNAWRVYAFSYPSGLENTPNFYVNGTKTVGSATGGGANGAATGTSAEIRVGRRDDGGPQMDGYMAELAAWSVELTDAEQASLGKGFSPLLIRPASLILYLPMVRDADKDVRGGLAFTATNTPTVQSHPRVLMPRRRSISVPTAAAGGFSSAFFRENAGVGAVGGGPFARANAGLGAVA